MRSKALLLVTSLSMSVAGGSCATAELPAVPDDGRADPCAAGETYCGTDTAGNPICAETQNDPAHCGGCHAACRGSEANACVEGQCACAGGGRVSDACDAPALCVPETGQCVVPNAEGRACGSEGDAPCDTGAGAFCIGGACTVPDCNHEEACDGRDNDCDGHVDGTGPHPGQVTPLRRDCYSGDPAWDGVGLCRHGEETCSAEHWSACTGEVLPTQEHGALRCDGMDNDCDDCIDNRIDENGQLACGPFEPREFEVIFIIDFSGSMLYVLPAIISALQTWAAQIGGDPHIRFALVDPTDTLDTDDGAQDGISVRISLSDAAAFSMSIGGMGVGGASIEPVHQAATLVLNGTFDTELQAQAGARRFVIVFHDESNDGSNTVPGFGEASVCALVSQAASPRLVVFTHPAAYEEWDSCTSGTSVPPTLLPLSGDAGQILAGLVPLIPDSDCQP